MAMARSCDLVLLALLVAGLAASLPLALAYDPSPLQDFCVADAASDATQRFIAPPYAALFLNGVACKDPARVSAGDFAFSGLDAAGDTANALGSRVTLVDARAVPGLNSLGVSMASLDLAPGGLNPPHTHPRASEVLTVVEGQMHAGGLVHFEINFGERPAVWIAGLSSQNPGVVRVADSLFGATPAVTDDVLAKAFGIDAATVQRIKAQFATKK
ncbi:putative germin-like protein 2-1 [Panicum virgatum]|uniref:putative germin-like protein 2-1 n=1 Tax=Panicum virgatum TaxID=38727 RepID=UPI0019D6A5EB|nr:putative germin-like protein 2-1 [Panicum virgatum]